MPPCVCRVGDPARGLNAEAVVLRDVVLAFKPSKLNTKSTEPHWYVAIVNKHHHHQHVVGREGANLIVKFNSHVAQKNKFAS